MIMELTDLECEEIARLIKEGDTGGIINDGEYQVNWNLQADKFRDE